MNFFEQELRKLVGQSNALADPRYIGRACYGRVSGNIRAKLQFVTMGHADHYEALQVTLINNTEGEIDRSLIRFRDLWGAKPVGNPNFKDGIHPHIWTYSGKSEWYCYQPTPADYELLADSLDEYLEVFSEDMEQGRGQNMT
jgi:hypothetical protein